MFGLPMMWAQNATTNYVAADQDGTLAGLVTMGFAIVFVGSLLFVGIREFLRMRREDRLDHTEEVRVGSFGELGPTMADGGEPMSPSANWHGRQTR